MSIKFVNTLKPAELYTHTHTHTHTHTSKALLSLLILPILVTPSFATVDISSDANSASCNNGTLSKYDGSVNLQAEWEPNTINVKWYNDTAANGATTPSTTNTCTYNSSLTVPAAPAKKTGYTFAGWRLRQACSFSNLNTSSNGTAYAAKELDGSSTSSTGGATVSTYGLSSAGDWGVTFSNGYATGISFCSDASGGSNPGSTSGEHCWCKATAYTLNGGTSCQVTQSHNSWVEVPVAAIEGISSCVNFCAGQCAENARTSSSYRLAMFGESNVVSQCSFSSLNTSSNGTAYAAKPIDGGTDSTYGGANASTYGLSSAGDWGVTFSNGYVTGTSLCSNSSSGNNPATGGGVNCWCKATGYKLTGGSNQSVSGTEWAFNTAATVIACIDDDVCPSATSYCAQQCAADCAEAVRNYSSYRETILCGESSSSGGGNSEVEPVIDEII